MVETLVVAPRADRPGSMAGLGIARRLVAALLAPPVANDVAGAVGAGLDDRVDQTEFVATHGLAKSCLAVEPDQRPDLLDGEVAPFERRPGVGQIGERSADAGIAARCFVSVAGGGAGNGAVRGRTVRRWRGGARAPLVQHAGHGDLGGGQAADEVVEVCMRFVERRRRDGLEHQGRHVEIAEVTKASHEVFGVADQHPASIRTYVRSCKRKCRKSVHSSGSERASTALRPGPPTARSPGAQNGRTTAFTTSVST